MLRQLVDVFLEHVADLGDPEKFTKTRLAAKLVRPAQAALDEARTRLNQFKHDNGGESSAALEAEVARCQSELMPILASLVDVGSRYRRTFVSKLDLPRDPTKRDTKK
jgi:hypothetical protein